MSDTDDTIAHDDDHARAQIARTTGDVRDVLVRLAENPAFPPELLDWVRFAAMQAWNAGWASRGLDRRGGEIMPNPFASSPGGEQPTEF